MTDSHDKTVQVTCPNCKAQGKAPEDKLKGDDLKIRCKKCGHSFIFQHERRTYYRKRAFPLVRFGAIGDDFERLLGVGYILDLSMTGMRLRADQPPEDRFINFRFNLPPQNETMRLKGEVVWVKTLDEGGYAFGVHFTQVDHHHKKILGFFLMA